MAVSRRFILATGVTGFAALLARPLLALSGSPGPQVSSLLLDRALGALDRHRASITRRDYIGIADFSVASFMPRFHLLDVAGGQVTSHWVAHGRGSDPEHTGWLERFSNEPRSNATSAGAYKTDCVYIGGHGRSLRLDGLDPSNSNAAARAIVVHGASYVSAELVRDRGVLGRSLGCFALAHSSLEEVLAKLGPDRLLYADKV